MNRRRLILSSPILVAFAVGSFLWLTAPRHRINEDTIKLIHEGMTQAEVEAVFGVPPGNNLGSDMYTLHDAWAKFVDDSETGLFPLNCELYRVGEKVAIGVAFDRSGRVNSASYFHFP